MSAEVKLEDFVNQWQTAKLPNGLVVEFMVQPAEQQAPKIGDNLVATGYLNLPMRASGSEYLHDELQYEKRLSLLGEELNANWGVKAKHKGFRQKTCVANAKTWREALIQVHIYIIKTIEILSETIENRMAILMSEGHEYAASKRLIDIVSNETEPIEVPF